MSQKRILESSTILGKGLEQKGNRSEFLCLCFSVAFDFSVASILTINLKRELWSNIVNTLEEKTNLKIIRCTIVMKKSISLAKAVMALVSIAR
jgi:hypothetical protein